MVYTSAKPLRALPEIFSLDLRTVSDQDRDREIKDVARRINRWYDPTMVAPPDGMVLVAPEGFGKSHLVTHLVERRFKIVFCCKSNAQAIEKEKSMRAMGLEVARYVSREQNLRERLSAYGVEDFKVISYDSDNPYAATTLNEPATVAALQERLDAREIDEDAADLLREHYFDYEAPALDGASVDVLVMTIAAFQALSTSKRKPWWELVGLVESTRQVTVDENNEIRLQRRQRSLTIGDQIRLPVPFKKVAVIIDDPDRTDVDWLRPVSQDAAERLQAARKPISERALGQESPEFWRKWFPESAAISMAEAAKRRHTRMREEPIHRVENINGRMYVRRPTKAAIGHRLRIGAFMPKVIVTTTEWLTGYLALETLRHTGLRAVDHVNLFNTERCLVTAVSTTITRKADHAVLLPIVAKLREEFPERRIHLIADGIGAELTLSGNKGRNDLAADHTIIKLSWPHPTAYATVAAHFEKVMDRDLLAATMLADLGNQAIGRNQGFRFQGAQAIVLIDPRYFNHVMQLIRYAPTPWSSMLPKINKKTSKARLARVMFSTEASAFEKRLIELIANFETFGRSEEARALVATLPPKQQDVFNEWLAQKQDADPALAAKREKIKAQTAERVRRYRQAKKEQRAAAASEPEKPLEPQRQSELEIVP